MFGDVWQWTASAYVALSRLSPAAGAVGEYNGKFMMRPDDAARRLHRHAGGHSRATYRNFFYPHQRWMFSGVRLAEDAGADSR